MLVAIGSDSSLKWCAVKCTVKELMTSKAFGEKFSGLNGKVERGVKRSTGGNVGELAVYWRWSQAVDWKGFWRANGMLESGQAADS